MTRKKTQAGFTIVETTIAIGFLSVLLTTIAILTLHISSVYQKGLSMKAVSSTGRELIDDFSRAISSSAAYANDKCEGDIGDEPRQRCEIDNARKYINQTIYDNLKVESEETTTTVPTGGVFCTGRYSYLWNSGYALKQYSENHNIDTLLTFDGYKDSVGNHKVFRLLKIADTTRHLCSQHVDTVHYSVESDGSGLDFDTTYVENYDKKNFTIGGTGTVEELLTSSEDNLALYSLDIFRPTQHTISRHSFYSGTFILATVQGGVDITGTGDYCKGITTSGTSSESGEVTINYDANTSGGFDTTGFDTDFNYCSINKFNFATRATGENKS